ncbi:MAG: TIGR02587 family membrane protein [Verrucomicrobiales bacterium]
MSAAPADRNRSPTRGSNRKFLIGVARASGGAIVFGLPLLMTMEMWWLGFYIERARLALLLFISIPLLVGLSHYAGFEETFGWQDDLVNSFVAYAVGFVASGVLVSVLGVIESGMAIDEIFAEIALLALPAGIGASLAASQFGSEEDEEKKKRRFTRYEGELFLMAVGAIFLALNVAPTDEMELIGHMMSPWHKIGLAVLSLLIMHAFVYAVDFSGQALVPPNTPAWSLFLRFTLPGYAIALLISLYLHWTFGRIDGTDIHTVIGITVVLGFPAAVGAAAARLVI